MIKKEHILRNFNLIELLKEYDLLFLYNWIKANIVEDTSSWKAVSTSSFVFFSTGEIPMGLYSQSFDNRIIHLNI